MSELDNNIEIENTIEDPEMSAGQEAVGNEEIISVQEETEEIIIAEEEEEDSVIPYQESPIFLKGQNMDPNILPEENTPKEEDEAADIQKPWHRAIPVVDHRLVAGKLSVYNWLSDLPDNNRPSEVVEVRFKNTRKGFYSNPSQLDLKEGDVIAVEAALGHDIGIISLTGELVKEQMRMKKLDLNRNPLKKVYRKAKPNDIEKWQQAIAMEHETMIKSRKIAADLNLNMKIGDVEYQGDKTKAIFYYIAEDRVDFRALIKILTETFRIRIEMKQIGARQEAGRIGGIGPCGLKLCCSTFISNFVSVSTSAARYQDISLNPQKLAGQCGKLKCCLNYEVDAYIDEQKDFPSTNIPLNTGEGMLYHLKTDIFGRSMYYAFDRDGKGVLVKLSIKRIKEIIAMNRKGTIPPKANDIKEEEPEDIKYTDGVGEESLNRFDDKKQKKFHPKNRNNGNNNANNGNNNNRNTNNPNRNNNTNRNNNRNNNNRGQNPNNERPADNKPILKNNPQGEQRNEQKPE